jgi:hypothetical protein
VTPVRPWTRAEAAIRLCLIDKGSLRRPVRARRAGYK